MKRGGLPFCVKKKNQADREGTGVGPGTSFFWNASQKRKEEGEVTGSKKGFVLKSEKKEKKKKRSKEIWNWGSVNRRGEKNFDLLA